MADPAFNATRTLDEVFRGIANIGASPPRRVEPGETESPFGRPGQHYTLNGGDQWKFTFPNGYGASVVRHSFSYGYDLGLWELAVLDSDGNLTYDTPITDDVIGRLTEDEVASLLAGIEALP